jgi:hypothetical protein
MSVVKRDDAISKSKSKTNTKTNTNKTKKASIYEIQSTKAKLKSVTEEDERCLRTFAVCSKCGINQNLTCFSNNTSGADHFDSKGYILKRPECKRCSSKALQSKNAAIRNANKAGLSIKAPLDAKCDMCHKNPKSGNKLVFDHCPNNDKFRGFLHNSCNRSMGTFGDDVNGALNMLNYLLRFEPTKIIQNLDGTLSIAPDDEDI